MKSLHTKILKYIGTLFLWKKKPYYNRCPHGFCDSTLAIRSSEKVFAIIGDEEEIKDMAARYNICCPDRKGYNVKN
jgi:hypothetical protein